MANNLIRSINVPSCDTAHAPVAIATAIDSFWNSAVKNDLFAMAFLPTPRHYDRSTQKGTIKYHDCLSLLRGIILLATSPSAILSVIE